LWKSAQLLAQFQEVLSEALGIPAHEIGPEFSFDEFRADSLDVVELVMSFEDEFDATIPDDEFDRIRTVGDAVRYFEQRQRGGE